MRALARLLLSTALALTWAPAQAAAVGASDQIKTAYLLNFARLVQWPDSRDARPLVLCIEASDALLRFVHDNLDGKEVQQRVLRVRSAKDPRNCDMLYQSAGAPRATGRGILSVGEGVEFARQGGMLGFVSVDAKLRYVINARAFAAAGLVPDPRLQAVAVETLQ